MAKPRVFVSSTYYDLRHIRNSLEAFIDSMGYEPVLFESGDIPFHHDQTLAESCYAEIRNSHMLVLIVGGRYGSSADDRPKQQRDEIEKTYELFNSVTKKEYESARERDIPIFIFVEKGVKAEYETFRHNRDNKTIRYAHVDSTNVFRLLDDILIQKRNNFVKDFDKFDDISIWLKDQWAGLFADFLSRARAEASLKDLASQISELNSVSSVLKEYTESILRKVQAPDEANKVIHREERKSRQRRIPRFAREPMIRYIVEENPSISGDRLYEAFEHAKDLPDFLKRSGLPRVFIEEELMKKHGKEAEQDFMEMKNRYLSAETDE